jgi:hypothetical protein
MPYIGQRHDAQNNPRMGLAGTVASGFPLIGR